MVISQPRCCGTPEPSADEEIEMARMPYPATAGLARTNLPPEGCTSALSQLEGGSGASASAVLDTSAAALEAFRESCRGAGYKERNRLSVVSRHDPSVRYTNSTISVLKPLLVDGVRERAFLMQPALRLRNLNHYQQTGEMSAFGCSFMSFGALGPAEDAVTLTEIARTFLTEGLGIADADLRMRVRSDDIDLMHCGTTVGIAIERSSQTPEAFRHKFGMPGVTGRNANLAVRGRTGWADVANVIVIEEEGQPIGVELAFGVNVVLKQLLGLGHPVLGGVAAAAVPYGVTDLMALDALSSATVLAMEGVKPTARGRGQNYRAFLRILGERAGLPDAELIRAALAVAEAEEDLRRHSSPVANGFADLPAAMATQALDRGMRRVLGRLPSEAPALRK